MKLGAATVKDIKKVIKITKKAKCDSTKMRFTDLGPVTEWSLVAYGDAGYKSLPDKLCRSCASSCGGRVTLLTNEEEKLCVLNWKSKKLRRVFSSPTAAEVLSANEALDDMVYIKHVLI